MATIDRAEVNISLDAITGNNALTHYVETPGGVLYNFYIDANSDPGFKKSTDGGITWGSFTQLKACTGLYIAIWADWWSGITATAYIHVVYTESDNDDTFYRYVDTANSDTLGTERTVYAGTSAATTGFLSITCSRGGKLMVATCIDAGAEYDTVTSTDLFVNKTSINEVWEGAASDVAILFPNPDSADNQDVCAIFFDSSASALTLKKYDDSAGTWAESAIASSVTAVFTSYNIAFDGVNNQWVFVCWNATDAANADYLCYTINDSGVTAKTDIITNSTDDQSNAGLIIIGSKWYALYMGLTDGSETYPYSQGTYYKISTDYGTTWGSETLISNTKVSRAGIETTIICYTSLKYIFKYYLFNGTGSNLRNFISIPAPPQPRASFQLGM